MPALSEAEEPTSVPPTNTPEPTPTPLPVGWVTFETANSPVSRTGHAMAMLPDGRVLLSGGKDENGNALGDTWLFKPQGYSLAPVGGVKLALHSGPGWLATGLARPLFEDWNPVSTNSSPDARFGHSMVALSDGRALVFGGAEEAGEMLNDLHGFSPDNDWNPILPENDPPPGRYMHLAWAYNNSMYVQGGLGLGADGKTTLYEDMWRYYLDTNTWEQIALPPYPPASFISPNAYPVVISDSVQFVDPHRYPFSDGTDLVYNMEEIYWDLVKVTNPPPGQRNGYMMVQVGDKAYMMGGGIYDPDTQTTTYVAEVWMLDLITRVWTQLADMLPFPIYGGAAVYDSVQNRITVWGGKQGEETFVPGNMTQVYYLAPFSLATALGRKAPPNPNCT